MCICTADRGGSSAIAMRQVLGTLGCGERCDVVHVLSNGLGLGGRVREFRVGGGWPPTITITVLGCVENRGECSAKHYVCIDR